MGSNYTLIAPPARGPWLAEVDYNCFTRIPVSSSPASSVAETRNGDIHSWKAKNSVLRSGATRALIAIRCLQTPVRRSGARRLSLAARFAVSGVGNREL